METPVRAVLNAVKREGGTAYVASLPGLCGLERKWVALHLDTLVSGGYLKREGAKVTVTAKGKAAR